MLENIKTAIARFAYRWIQLNASFQVGPVGFYVMYDGHELFVRPTAAAQRNSMLGYVYVAGLGASAEVHYYRRNKPEPVQE